MDIPGQRWADEPREVIEMRLVMWPMFMLIEIQGRYAFRTFPTDDGCGLDRLGDTPLAPSVDDVAVAFYRDGTLLEQYNDAQIIRDATKLARWVDNSPLLLRASRDSFTATVSRFSSSHPSTAGPSRSTSGRGKSGRKRRAHRRRVDRPASTLYLLL